MQTLEVKKQIYKLPIYLPDATRAVVKSIDSVDMKNAGTRGVVVNTYHLMQTPGPDSLKVLGGVKGLMKFNGLVVSDSGGWQVFSLIHRSSKPGKISDKGVTFNFGGGSSKVFTPEMSIQMQFSIGSDIIICLDDFTPPNAPRPKIEESVERTTRWAKRCKQEYERILIENNIANAERPLLFAVIQGGLDKEMRKTSAEQLVEIGFDGYGFGGYVVDSNGDLDLDISKYIASLIPQESYKFALGVGHPWEIAMCNSFGWQIFDCTLPTRDARHKRLYVFSRNPLTKADAMDKKLYEYIYIDKKIYQDDLGPICSYCDCYTCLNYSRAYLKHLFAIGDTLAYRLASIHNIKHYNRVIDLLADN